MQEVSLRTIAPDRLQRSQAGLKADHPTKLHGTRASAIVVDWRGLESPFYWFQGSRSDAGWVFWIGGEVDHLQTRKTHKRHSDLPATEGGCFGRLQGLRKPTKQGFFESSRDSMVN